MGSFENFAKHLLNKAFEDIRNDIVGRRRRRRRRYSIRLKHVYRCVETIDFVHNGQDIYNGVRILYQKGQIYSFSNVFPDSHVIPDAHKYFRLMRIVKVREG